MTLKHELSSKFVQTAKYGMYCDGDGLWLKVRKDGGYQWIFRYSLNAKQSEIGLGGSRLTLKEARKKADEYRVIAKSGVDPKQHKRILKHERSEKDYTLQTITMMAFEAKKHSLKGDGKSGRWLSPLTNHILPRLGNMPVDQIHQRDIKEVLAPLWHKKHATAEKAINRLNIVLKHAAAMDIEVDLQATMKAKLLLGTSSHIVEHVKALPWQDVPAFYQTLTETSTSHLALKLLILTGVRSGPIRQLQSSQILDSTWLISGDLMKGVKGKTPDFRVPLSDEALRIIAIAKQFERDGFIFPGVSGTTISDATMAKLMSSAGMDERPHGFRTSLRTWLSDQNILSYEASEMVLAHSVGTSVARAYNRTDYLDQRQVALNKWALYISGGCL